VLAKRFDELPDHTKKLLSEIDEDQAKELLAMNAKQLVAVRELGDLIASGKVVGKFIVWVIGAFAGGAAALWTIIEVVTKIIKWKGLG
jgi:hypothetical protein